MNPLAREMAVLAERIETLAPEGPEAVRALLTRTACDPALPSEWREFLDAVAHRVARHRAMTLRQLALAEPEGTLVRAAGEAWLTGDPPRGPWLRPLSLPTRRRGERVFEGHGESVRSIVVFDDGRRAVSAARDGTVRLWNLETCAQEAILDHDLSEGELHDLRDMNLTLARGADGDWLVACAFIIDGDVTVVWDLARRARRVVTECDATLLLPDGRSAWWTHGCYLTRWQLADGQRTAEILRRDMSWHVVALRAEGRELICLGRDGIERWDLDARTRIAHFAQGVRYRGAVLTRDARSVWALRAGALERWSIDTGRCEETRVFEGEARGFCVLPEGTHAVVVCADGRVTVFDLARDASLIVDETPDPEAWEPQVVPAFAPDAVLLIYDHALAEVGLDGRLHARVMFPRGDLDVVVPLASSRALCGCRDGSLRIVALDRIEARNPRPERFRSVASCADGRHVVALQGSGATAEITRIDVDSGLRERIPWSLPHASVFDPGGRFLAAWRTRGVALFDLGTGAPCEPLDGPRMLPDSLIFDREGATLFAVGEDQRLWRWELPAGKAVPLLPMPLRSARVLGVAQGGARVLLSTNREGVAEVRTLGPNGSAMPLRSRTSVHQGIFLPDGRHLLTAHADGSIHRWDLRTRKRVSVHASHTRALCALTLHPRGRWLLSVGHDRCARVWDLDADALLAEWHADARLLDGTFVGDDRVVLTGEDGVAIFRLHGAPSPG